MHGNDMDSDSLDGNDRAYGSNDEIKSLLMSLSLKIDTLNDTMSGNDARINAKIDNLEATLSDKIKDVKTEVEMRVQKVTEEFDQRFEKSMFDVKQMCEEKTTSAMKVLTVRVDKLQAHSESRLDRLERFSIEKDIVISGVPLENNDDPFAIVGDICGALNCNLQQGDFVSAFRLTSNRINSKTVRTQPIVVKTREEWVKRELLTAYFKKANLNLTDIGFKTPARIYINERLTSANREIFNRAAEAKKSNFVHRFFTRRGLVYIQRADNTKTSCIIHISELDSLFPLNYNRQHHINGRARLNDPAQQNFTQSTNNQPVTKTRNDSDVNQSSFTPNSISNPTSTSSSQFSSGPISSQASN